MLLFNPLCLLLLPCWLRRVSAALASVAVLLAHRHGDRVLRALAFFVKIFPAFAQDNRFWIALLLPLHLAFAHGPDAQRRQSVLRLRLRRAALRARRSGMMRRIACLEPAVLS